MIEFIPTNNSKTKITVRSDALIISLNGIDQVFSWAQIKGAGRLKASQFAKEALKSQMMLVALEKNVGETLKPALITIPVEPKTQQEFLAEFKKYFIGHWVEEELGYNELRKKLGIKLKPGKCLLGLLLLLFGLAFGLDALGVIDLERLWLQLSS